MVKKDWIAYRWEANNCYCNYNCNGKYNCYFICNLMVSPCYFHCNCNLSFVIFIVIISLHLSHALLTKSSPPPRLASWERLFHHTLTERGQREKLLLNVFWLLKHHLEIKIEFIQTTSSQLISSLAWLKYNSEMPFEHFLEVVKITHNVTVQNFVKQFFLKK